MARTPSEQANRATSPIREHKNMKLRIAQTRSSSSRFAPKTRGKAPLLIMSPFMRTKYRMAPPSPSERFKRPTKWVVALGLMSLLLVAGVRPAVGQLTYQGALTGNVLDNSGLIPFDQAYFAFEVESVLESLKDAPIWNELEKLLDRPYAIALDTDIPGSYPSLDSGFDGNYYFTGLPLSVQLPGLAWLSHDPTAPPLLHLPECGGQSVRAGHSWL